MKLENHFFITTDREMHQLYYHMPTRAANFVMYQCIVTSARILHPTAAWLSYNVIILAASDSTSIRTYDTLTRGCNSRQSYTPYTSAKQAL